MKEIGISKYNIERYFYDEYSSDCLEEGGVVYEIDYTPDYFISNKQY